ncbi:hypothetical protein PUNSTDRAFT_46767 [Punctularia strigosozonata HHB-11173 SS5]|uniref:uncharacterized protein n=1 Tax=Punctularia strigosozonata (strain HHB-11173) TaxID=741275 RepID=UPI000441751C|nr:uncharacterized protein PUNSTDRAFT_46767 [Punctularia strigosozonata HHB-11173 SS5]EIN05356.1 hypothetical protein PUNSTDRAFT_46767 [Punctularia strigosozonata HHB-11173 SS5]
MSSIRIDQAELAGFIAESVLYGTVKPCLSLAILGISLFLLLRRRSSGQSVGSPIVKGALVVATVLLLILSTAHWCLDADRAWSGFVETPGAEGLPGSLLFYAQLWDARNVARTIIFTVQATILDAVLVYRVYVIWNNNWLPTILPALATVGTFGMTFRGQRWASLTHESTVSGIGVSIAFSKVQPGEDVFISTTGNWITSVFSLSLGKFSTNVLAIALIGWRIIRRDRVMKSYTSTTLSPLLLILVESAALVSCLNLMTLTAYEAQSNVQFISVAMSAPMTGISFGLIIVRVGLGMAGGGSAPTFLSTASRPGVTTGNGSTYPMQLRITKETEYDYPAPQKDSTSWSGGSSLPAV